MQCLRNLVVGLGFLAAGCSTSQPEARTCGRSERNEVHFVQTAIIVDGNFGSRLIRGQPNHEFHWAMISSSDAPTPTSDDQVIEAFAANDAVLFGKDTVIDRPKWLALCSVKRGTAASEFKSVKSEISGDGVLAVDVELKVVNHADWTPRGADLLLIISINDQRNVRRIVVQLTSRIGASSNDVFYEEHRETACAEISFR